MDAGFFLPFTASERWYRNELENTGIAYGMVLGHPHARYDGQDPRERSKKDTERDREMLESFRTEYEARHTAEESFVKAAMSRPETIVAHVIYNTLKWPRAGSRTYSPISGTHRTAHVTPCWM